MEGLNRVILNTGILYIKLLISMLVGLMTTRIVLQALGESDFGIYTLVGGVVGMLAIVQSSMSIASMRFMAHSLGTKDQKEIKETFNSILFLHFIIGILMICFMELGGVVLFKYFLNIPESKIFASKIIFQFMIISTFITIISVPYDAVINAHENILALSIVDLLGVFIKLGIAIFLLFNKSNLLIWYGFLMMVNQMITRIIKQLYSVRKYSECKIEFKSFVNKPKIKSILSFTGWNLFGSIAAVSVTQVRSILLNMFFGVKINAAEGISRTACNQVNMISSSMTRALNPQLVKSEGSGDRFRMLRITEFATKYSVLLFSLFSIPVILETHYLLDIWLKDVPEYAVIFSRLVLIGLLLDKFTFEITSAIRAVGDIRKFQITETILIILNIPVSYLLFKFSYPPYSIYFVSICFTVIVSVVRLHFGSKIANLDINRFLQKGILPTLAPIIVGFTLAYIPHLFIDKSFFRLTITGFISIFSVLSIARFFGMTTEEILKIKSVLNSIIKR